MKNYRKTIVENYKSQKLKKKKKIRPYMKVDKKL